MSQISQKSITGITSASNFKTGSSNLHSTGLTVGDTFVHATGVNGSSADIDDFISVGNNIHLGNAGVITATSFSGDGSALSNVSAGKVVKFGLATSTTLDQYGAQDTYTLVGPQLTFTGSSASNKLLLLHNHHMLIENASFWFMALFRDGTSGTKVHEKRWYSQNDLWIGQTGIHSVLLDIPDTSSHTYQFAIYRTSGTNRMVYNHTSGTAQLIALEIDPS